MAKLINQLYSRFAQDGKTQMADFINSGAARHMANSTRYIFVQW